MYVILHKKSNVFHNTAFSYIFALNATHFFPGFIRESRLARTDSHMALQVLYTSAVLRAQLLQDRQEDILAAAALNSGQTMRFITMYFNIRTLPNRHEKRYVAFAAAMRSHTKHLTGSSTAYTYMQMY